MKVPKKVHQKWVDLYTNGDYTAIQAEMKGEKAVTVENIRICLKRGEFHNMDIYEVATKFYLAKEKRLKEIAKMK